MWKLIIGFIVLAALAVFVLSRSGDVDIGGEKHDVGAPGQTAHPPASAASR